MVNSFLVFSPDSATWICAIFVDAMVVGCSGKTVICTAMIRPVSSLKSTAV